MDKIEKFLRKLTRKQRSLLKSSIFPKILNLELKNLDVKPLKGYKGFYRMRVGKLRVIFYKNEPLKNGVLIAIDYRENVYKNF